jgi:hypothetical protein
VVCLEIHVMTDPGDVFMHKGPSSRIESLQEISGCSGICPA